MNTYDQLLGVARGLNAKFPKGNEPYQIATRLAEETGEVCKEINHFEGAGMKAEKYGDPDKMNLAGEVKNTITCALQVLDYYDLHEEFAESVSKSYKKLADFLGKETL